MYFEERVLLGLAGFIIAIALVGMFNSAMGPVPVNNAETILVGTGCQGEHDIAVAYEEDAMPTCETIEVHYVR